ncbi:MAG TPA: hypothetical protein DEQ20_06900 [Desulfobulbaceae bacterium]|nr:MAG: hypothetical protein A2520_01330 [Deltaproteobacteria bacterium RIFOXYD12_FULL_53_23]HCC54635.1 hypothetical protein [Desulfobulbaceae bacterium]
MTYSDFFSMLSAVSLFAIAVAIVPTFLQFRRTWQKIEVFIDALNTHVDPLCKSLTKASHEIQLLSISLSDKLEKTDKVIYTAQKSADILLTTATILKETVSPFISKIGGFSTGIMTFAHFLNRSLKTTKKRSLI